MATLENKSVKATLPAVVKYNNNPDKNLPPDGLIAAAAYIRGDHSVERLYSRGHNGCSCNPETAIEQFRMSEALYREKKCGARESGLAEGKTPTIAEHLFMSFPVDENVSYDMQCEIADKLCSSEILRDFYAISNRHYNTDNDHSHILVSNYAKDGSRKLSLNKTKRAALQKELNRICVGYGLSIIDNPALRRNDSEYEEFVRSCVGKIKVYAPANYERYYADDFGKWMTTQIANGNVIVADGRRRANSQEEAYKRWIAEQEEFIRVRNKKAAKKRKAVLIAVQQAGSKAAREYYWNEKYKRNNHYYAVRRYDDYGYHKPMLNLMVELMYLVSTQEEHYFREKYPQRVETFNSKTDTKLQAMIDCSRYQREQGVRTFAELNGRIEQVGTELSEVRQGKKYYENAIERGNELYQAILTFNTMEARLKKNGALTEEEKMVGNEAYRIMAKHNCTEPYTTGEFIRKRQFAERKVKNLTEQEQRLKKDYHDLKFIDSHSEHLAESIEYYVYRNQETHSLDDLISNATSKTKSAETRSARDYIGR